MRCCETLRPPGPALKIPSPLSQRDRYSNLAAALCRDFRKIRLTLARPIVISLLPFTISHVVLDQLEPFLELPGLQELVELPNSVNSARALLTLFGFITSDLSTSTRSPRSPSTLPTSYSPTRQEMSRTFLASPPRILAFVRSRFTSSSAE